VVPIRIATNIALKPVKVGSGLMNPGPGNQPGLSRHRRP
jgi:hypothetical protein